MREHLTNDEMLEDADSLHAEIAAHLAHCPACRRERLRLRAALAAWTRDARLQAERPEAFWGGQRERIASGRPRRRHPAAIWKWVWTPAVVTAGIVVLLWTRQIPLRSAADPLGDHELLAAVERSIHAGVPSALQPAALLVREMERGVARTGGADSIWQGGRQ